MNKIAYLDIETTGLSPRYHDLTVIGIHFEGQGRGETVQLVGEDIRPRKLIQLIKDIDLVYTYNGARFDLPFIKENIGVDIKKYCRHDDLMYACWKKDLKGGLKAVERKLGIKRKLTDVDGWVAVQLWHKYASNGCKDSLNKLLRYNEEDIVNLKKLRKKLSI